LQAIDLSKVEVEVRVGMIIAEDRRWRAQIPRKIIYPVSEQRRIESGLEFKAGVDEIFVEHLKKVLSSDRFTCTQLPPQRLRSDQRTGKRWEVDANDRVMMVERKERFYRYDQALVSHIYDIRIDGAIERPMPSQGGNGSSDQDSRSHRDNWQTERLKRRKTYRSKVSESQAWKIDVTEVDISENRSTSGASGSTSSGILFKEMELEFELESAAAVAWLQEEEQEKAVQQTRVIATQLFHLLNLCIPGEAEPVNERPLVSAAPEVTREIIRLNDVLKRASTGMQSSSAAFKVNYTGSYYTLDIHRIGVC
jgi:hypothetical protein